MESKIKDSKRTIPLTTHTYTLLCDVRTDASRIARDFHIAEGDPYILDTQVADSRPYNSTALSKDFASFCR